MTRIIAGVAKSRRLKVPAKGTRPTSDRVREALFNLLDHQIVDWHEVTVLDLFAGSGALALEAVSRGAKSALAVDQNRAAIEVIRENSHQLDLKVDLITQDASQFAKQLQPEPFKLIFIDPPYEFTNLQISEMLDNLVTSGAISVGSIVIVERSSRGEPLPTPAGVVSADERKYGETRLFVFRW